MNADKNEVEDNNDTEARSVEDAIQECTGGSGEDRTKSKMTKVPGNRNTNVHDAAPKERQEERQDKETVEQLKNQLDTLMNSLATLSAEKSKMEANFQNDKKQLRNEREECEKVIKDLKEKLKKAQNNNYSEIEHAKCKLIMERHEREKEQAEHSAITKELQRLLNEERRAKEQMEGQLKVQFANKTQCKILEAELEITKNKLKQAEQAAKETPPLLVSLQAEMATMKKQHRNAIHDEQKRAAAAEQRARALAITHEARVAGLESRLAELSEIVGGYDRLRLQDQLAIQKLKERLASMRGDTDEKETDASGGKLADELISRIKHLYGRLLELDNKKNDSVYAKSLINSLKLCDNCKHSEYKGKYESLLEEFENYKKQVSKGHEGTNAPYTSQQQRDGPADTCDNGNNITQLHLLKVHNSNLEERTRMLSNQMKSREKELQMQLDVRQRILQEERARMEQILFQKENEYRSRISTLEQQLLRQRERSMTLVEEKDREIARLKASSLHALLPSGKESLQRPTADARASLTRRGGGGGGGGGGGRSESAAGADLTGGALFTGDSPPILHYTQELARKEVQISASRKRVLELEASLRERQREILHANEKHKEEIESLQSQVTRLEACKSREGANLEYLKNVIINYLTTNDASSKRHMLNAISTVLRFTPEELARIKNK